MPDFTVNTYIRLIEALRNRGYEFQTFEQFLTHPEKKTIVIRHDVDARPENSLRLAKIERKYGIVGTYNFRIVPQSWNPNIIKEISDLGHEIGYHYEELETHNGDQKEAYKAFKENLKALRKLVPVSTICMHGSPTSKFDSRELWKTRSYRRLKITGEPYLDVDYTNTLYLTDTGRRWNGNKTSILDRISIRNKVDMPAKVDLKRNKVDMPTKVDMKQNQILKEKGYRIRKTPDLIKASNERALPDQIMLTIHPQRWHCHWHLWAQELIFQNLKFFLAQISRQNSSIRMDLFR